MSESANKAKAEYNAKTYDEIKLRVKKGKKDLIKKHADAAGKSVNSFIEEAIEEKIDRSR